MIHVGPPAGADEDGVTARSYRHPVLGERAVVRLVGETLAPAEDLELEYYGFAAPERVVTVGADRRQALGFPAWALVNDPANGHHALNLVKEMSRLGRLAAVKPGNAKTELLEIGTRLSGSAPHFLPSFYEQAGRIFLALGNVGAAKTMFAKAREAERVHGLAVDPVQLRDVYIEFGLAGAVSGKDMSEYARFLSKYDEAYELFWTACLRWVRSGLSPYAAMAKDLKRLAKRDVSEELLREVLAADGAKRASKKFWESQRGALVALASREPRIRRRLLDFVPFDTAEFWLEILNASGATAELTERSDVDAAAWLAEFMRHFQVYGSYTWRSRSAAYQHVPLRELIVAMADRLRADGVAVELPDEADLIDLCLEHKIPVAPMTGRISLNGSITRELSALVADERFRQPLFEGLEAEFVSSGTIEALPKIVAVAGLRGLLTEWLTAVADQISTAGLVRMSRRLTRYRQLATPEMLSHASQAAQRIAQIDVAEKLAATLRGGILDELGWPALEEAVAKLGGTRPEPDTYEWEVQVVGEAWPALIVACGPQVIVVGPDEILLEHAVRIPPDQRHPDRRLEAFYAAGKLMVCFLDWRSQWHAYWSHQPDRIFRLGARPHSSLRELSASIAAPGGRLVGEGVLHPGDTKLPELYAVHSDGTSTCGEKPRFDHDKCEWAADWQPAELPQFLTGLPPGGGWLRPVAPGSENGLFGSANGLHGWRATEHPDGGWLAESVDGTKARLDNGKHKPFAAFSLPGSEPLTVAKCGRSTIEVFDVDSRMLAGVSVKTYRPTMARGTELVPPVQWWHCLRVRDEAGSLALRSVTVEMARQLLDGDDVREVLPGISHPALVEGLVGVVGLARRAAEKIADYRVVAEKPVKASEPVPEVDDGLLGAALTGHPNVSLTETSNNIRQMQAIAELAEAGPLTERVDLPGWSHAWWRPLSHLGEVGIRASSPITPADHRAALTGYLSALARTGIGARPHWRTVTVDVSKGDPDSKRGVLPVEHGFIALIKDTEPDDDLTRWGGVQYTTVPGEFPLPPKWTVKRTGNTPEAFDINRFLTLLAEHGPWRWRPEFAADLAARTGLSTSEAALLLAGPPDARPLPPAVRDTLGLTGAQATMAVDSISALSKPDGGALVHAAMPADPARLWTDGPDVEAVAEEWISRLGRRVAVDEEVLVDARKAIGYRHVNNVIAAIVTPAIWDRTYAGFTLRDLRHVVDVLSWLAYRLPAGSPLRARLPEVLATLRARVDDPETWFFFGAAYSQSYQRVADLLRQPLTGPTVSVDGWLELRETGACYQAWFRPSQLRPERREFMAALGEVLYQVADLTGLDHDLEQVCGQHAPSGYLQDPTVSVPDLVDRVVEKYTVDKDVAVLYLQLLALPDPTDANVARWTGWQPARLKAARAALAATDLVLTAKRSRAGRTLFLPGHWVDVKGPFEAWKKPLLNADFRLPRGTVEAAFRDAWQRVEDGDIPGYDELTT